MKYFAIILILISLIYNVNSWDNEELEIFDLVEEINKNFYELMGISQAATGQEIKRAFRNLSIILHPDKNSAEDANIQFRNLVSVYEVLKDVSKRQKYDKVLKDGLPNWKSALYYYRRMRKIGILEGSAIIFIIITIGQYFFAWAAYLEKKYTAEQVLGSKLKRMQKKNKNIDIDAILNEIPAPSVFHTLPFQIPLAIWHLPKTISSVISKANELKEKALEQRRLEMEEVKRQKELEEEMEELARTRKEKKENLRKRKQTSKVPEKTDAELIGYSQINTTNKLVGDGATKPVTQQKAVISGGFWSDEDLAELIRLVKKYPGGSSSRWEIIAEIMNRTVQEITFMAAKMKENGYRVPGQTDSVAENIVQETEAIVKKIKTKKVDNNILVPETTWSQEQQRTLEAAIIKYRKTGNTDRWQKIANCVQGKTKEECLLRYKYLCELVKSQKVNENNKEQINSTSDVIEDKCIEKTDISDKIDDDRDSQNNDECSESLDVKSKGKRKNKRKERKRHKEFSSDEDTDDDRI